MPYGIQKSGTKFKVVNKQTGRVFGTHESQAKAKGQLAALYVHANPHNESISLEVRMLKGGHIVDSINVIEEAVKKEVLVRAASILKISPESLMQFITDVDTEESLPHGNWICMAAAKNMQLNSRTQAQLKMMLSFFVRYKDQVVKAGKSGNIFDYPSYDEFRSMIFSFAKHAYSYEPTELPGVTKVYEGGPYAMYKISAKGTSPAENEAAIASLAQMGNGTKWCTRTEYNPSYANAKNYLITSNPDKTMFIVTKFNAPYIQCQANLVYIMDTEDKAVVASSAARASPSKLEGTLELSEIFGRTANEFNLTSSNAKDKFCALVGVKTKKAIEYFKTKGFDETTILMNLSKPLESMGYTEGEVRELYTAFILNVQGGPYNNVMRDKASAIVKMSEALFKTLQTLPLTGKALEFGQGLLHTCLENEKTAATIPSETCKNLMKEYLDRMSNDGNSSNLTPEQLSYIPNFLLAYCLFVQKAKWPEKEEAMGSIFEQEPSLRLIYDNLGSVIDDDDEREHDMKALVVEMTKEIKTGRDVLLPTERGAIRDAVLVYGRLPELEALIHQFATSRDDIARPALDHIAMGAIVRFERARKHARMIGKFYDDLLRQNTADYYVEEIED